MVPLRNNVVILFAGNAFTPDREPTDPRTGAKPAQLDECIDEARARLRREYGILVRISMGIEEGNLALLVLLRTVPHACFRAH